MRPHSKAHSLSKAALSLFLILLAAVTSWGFERGATPDTCFTLSSGGYYIISNAADLQKLAQFTNDGGITSGHTFKATNRIETTSIPVIGTSTYPFQGTFDGNNQEIVIGKQLYSTQSNIGLFGTIGSKGTVKKVHIYLESFSLTVTESEFSFGIIAGRNDGTIDSCYIGLNGGTASISLSANNDTTKLYIGGITGYNNGTIQNSSLYKQGLKASFSKGGAGYAGGIAGYNNRYIKYSTLGLNIPITSTGTATYTGGIAGYHAGGTISNSSTDYGASINATNASTRVGGIIGGSNNYGYLYDNFITNFSITSSGSLVGAIAGDRELDSRYTYRNFYHNITINGAKKYSGIGIGGRGDMTEENGAMPLADITILAGSNVAIQANTINDLYLYNSTITLNYTGGTVETGKSVQYIVKDGSGNILPVTYSGTKGTFAMPASDVTVKDTIIKTVTYTVKFNANNGSNQTKTQTFTNSESKSLTKNSFSPATGYGSFRFWTTNADGTGTSYADEQVVSSLTNTNGAEINLYAQWSKKLTNSDISIAAIEDVTYTGSALKPAITVKDGSTDITSKLTFAYSNNINVGTATVTITPASEKNGYEGSRTTTFNIIKVTPYIRTAPRARILAYSGSAQELVTAGSANVGTMVYSLNGTEFSNAIPKATDIGKYTVYYKVEETENNYGTEVGSVPVEIKESSNAVLPVAKTNLVYNGQEQVLITAGSTDVGTMLYRTCPKNATCSDYSEILPTATNAGTYTVYYKVSYSEEEAEIYTPISGNFSVTIKKAKPNITAPVLISDKVKYKENKNLITAGSTDVGTMTYCSCPYGTSSSYCKDSDYKTGIPKSGSHVPGDLLEVYYRVEGDENYETVKKLVGYVSIVKASVIRKPATATELTYNGKQQVLISTPDFADDYVAEINYYVNGTNIGSRQGYNTTQRYCSSNEYCLNGDPAAKYAGSYMVRYVVTVNTNNYYEGGEDSILVVINKADPFNMYLHNPPRELDLTYNGKPQNLVKAGRPGIETALYSLNDEVHFGETIPTATNAGTYTIYYKINLPADSAANYTDGFGSVTATIKKATPTVVAPEPKELKYGIVEQELVTAGTTNVGKMLYSLDGVNYSESIPAKQNAGTYTVYYKVSLSESEKENYEEVPDGSVQAVINKLEATMSTADTVYRVYGSNRSLGVAIHNICEVFYSLNGTDFSSNLIRADLSLNVGTYTIWAKGDPDNCYGETMKYYATITKATPNVVAPTANSITFNGESHELVSAGSTNFGTMLYSLDGNSFSEAIPTATNAGAYIVYYKVEESANWEKVLGSVEVTIGKKALTLLEPTPNELEYNGEPQELVSANSSSHMCTVYSLDGENYSKAIPTGKNSAIYSVYYMLDTKNCSGNATGGTIQVKLKRAILTAVPEGDDYDFNGEPQELATAVQPSFCEAKYSLDNGETFSTEIPTAVDAGTYHIVYEIDEKNCEGKSSGSFKSIIHKAHAKAPKPKELVYNGNPQELVAAGFPSSCLSYSLDKENFSEKIPTAVDARKYDVYFKVTNLQNCNEYEGLISTGIEPAQPKVNDPEARKLVYNGEAQELVTEGYANSGPMLYSLDGVNFSEEIPTAVDAGKYEIVVLVKATENYISYNKTITAYIDKLKTNEIYPIQGNKLVFNGKAQKLITAKGPNICLVYNVQTQTSISGFSKEFPTATNSDDYLITYKFDDNNCVGNNVEDAVNATIKPVAITLPPQAKQLAYTGEPQELVSKGYPEFCLTYSLDKKNFSENVPTGTKIGEYSVFYKVDERNCKGESGVLVSYIADRLPELTIVAPRTEKILLYTGKEQPLLEREGYVEMGQMLYSLNGVHFNEKIPTATDPGFYTIYYRALFKDFILGEGTVSTIIAEDTMKFAFVDVFRINKKTYATIDGNYTGTQEFLLKDIPVDTVIFNREFPITEGKNYSTLMLPFNTELGQLTGINENNVFEFAGVSRNKETGALQVEIARTKYINAYTPYIIQMSSPNLQIKGSVQLRSQDRDPIVNVKEWTLIGTLQYTKWNEKHPDLGRVYGFSAYPFETTSGKQYGAGQFVKFGKDSFIKPLRAYLRYEGSLPKNAPSPNGYAAPIASIENELPDQMDVVIVERDENGTEEHTTVIGKFNTRTGKFKMLRNYDLKGRKVNSTNKAHKAYYGKKVLKK